MKLKILKDFLEKLKGEDFDDYEIVIGDYKIIDGVDYIHRIDSPVVYASLDVFNKEIILLKERIEENV